VIQHLQSAVSDLQLYSLNIQPYLINNVEDNIVFLAWQVLIPIIPALFPRNRNAQSSVVEKPQMKIISFLNYRDWFLILETRHWHRCKSDLTTLKRMVTLNYVYRPIKSKKWHYYQIQISKLIWFVFLANFTKLWNIAFYSKAYLFVNACITVPPFKSMFCVSINMHCLIS